MKVVALKKGIKLMKCRVPFILFVITYFCCLACGVEDKTLIQPEMSVVPKGNRIIAIDVAEAEDGNYDAAVDLAKSVGMEQIGLFLTWTRLETAPETYDGTLLDIASAYYPAENLRVDLTLAPINTNQKEFPTDIADRPFDDPVVIERFKKLLDFVLDKTVNLEVSSLNIGSEMDIYFGSDEGEWQRYKTFYIAITDHIHAIQPGLKVATEPTFEGIMGPAGPYIKELNKYSDIIGVSYYGMKENGDVKEPSAVQADFEALTSLYEGSTIYFYQYGYPSSPELNSSETRQKQFVEETFRAWDKYAAQIQMIDFTWMHDKSPADVQEIATYYGVPDPKFAAFIGTLGLRTYSGADKQAFEALESEAKARGW